MRHYALTVAVAFSLAATCSATDTAFWKPYERDAKTFLLEGFDGDNAPAGRFGGAHRGPAAYVQEAPRLLLSGRVSLECWLKLDGLPEARAYPIQRLHAAARTRGFELYIEPSGAFGMAVQNCLGYRSELLSDAGLVPVGTWVHLAGISVSTEYNVLYIDGQEVKRVALSAQRGLSADRQKETVSAAVVVGAGVPGVLDEVRVHTNIAKLWPRPKQSWIAERADAELPPVDRVLTAGHRPLLHLPFDGGDAATVNGRDLGVVCDGEYVDGVRGQAFRGRFSVLGAVATAQQGAIEFWCRPVGINNYSDQNLTLFHNGLFSFYLFNSIRSFRPLNVVFRDPEKRTHFAGDRLGTEVVPGRWNHYLISWGSGMIVWYVNGEQAGGNHATFAWASSKHLVFNQGRYFGDVDELLLYDHSLGAIEAANAYWRYVDPARLQTLPEPRLAALKFWHLPSTRELYVRIQALTEQAAQAPVSLQIKDRAGELVFTASAAFSERDQRFVLPALVSADYTLNLRIGDQQTEPQAFRRQRFAWENSEFGVTDEVFSPFVPLEAGRRDVSVVLRELRLNAFGLWDSVFSKGKEILAAPMRVVAMSETGSELVWTGTVKRVSAEPHQAVYRAVSTCAAVRLETTSVVEMDGMMRVALKLGVVPDAVKLSRLYLEIPLQDSVAQLLHETADTIRRGYAGRMPAGEGEIWNSKQSMRGADWLNAFTGYIWMGGPERGLAWFAENDRGWVTAKNHDAPLMRIARSAGRVTLRIDLVNVPGVIGQPAELVFGVQASPTKPVPADYRAKALTLGGVGLSVHPWGGLSCSWKSPWLDKWEVVDKVIQGRNTGTVDRAWFEAFQAQYDVPKIHGVRDWVADVCRFASHTKPLTSPDPVYFEEMAVLPFIPEYHVFQDEWSLTRLAEKSTGSVDIYRTSGGREVSPSAKTNFARSYQDYTLSLMNEWMKRGVSMYWDNTYLKVSGNPWTSAAYGTADGRVQPATMLWNQRQYMKRTWNLMNHWRRQGTPRPLEFVAHMTNANLLPLFTWSTCNYDIEMSQAVYAKGFPDVYEPGEPYTPEFLLTESTGLQVGAYPYLVHAIFRDQCKLPEEALGPAPGQIEVGRREWGMRMVHEIINFGPMSHYLPSGTLNKAVYDFGYGSRPPVLSPVQALTTQGKESVDVWNYWDDTPAFSVDHDRVKGLLLTRKRDRAMLLVLQSWSKEPVTVTVAFLPDVIGFDPGSQVHDAFRNTHRQMTGTELTLAFDFPYETGLYVLDHRFPGVDVLFADDFDHGLNPGWDYISNYVTIDRGALRLAENRASWRGPPRILKWLNVPDFTDAELSFSFRVETIPTGSTEVLSLRFPATGVAWSKHGLTHSYLKGGVAVLARADPKLGWVWRATGDRDGKTATLTQGTAGTLDTTPHRVRIAVTSTGHYSLTVDGETAFELDLPGSGRGNGFQLAACRDPATTLGAVYLDDIVLRADTVDHARLQSGREQARARAGEILAAQINELKQTIIRHFGVFGHSAIYKLAMFRNPEADVADLSQRFRSETSIDRRLVLLEVLRELPEREREHVESMTAIGQPTDRLPEFRQARTRAAAFLREQLATGEDGVRDATAKTLAALETGGAR